MKETFQLLVDHLVTKGFLLEDAVELLERTMIQRALDREKGNRTAASRVLGIHRNTLQRKIEEYKLAEAPRKPAARAVAKRKAVGKRRA